MWVSTAAWRRGFGSRRPPSVLRRQRRIGWKVPGLFSKKERRISNVIRAAGEAKRMIEGHLSGSGLKLAIVVARFNSFITERLLEGALDGIRRSGGSPDDAPIYRVPGSWEMPVVVGELVKQNRFDAVICLGAVIRGETPHFDYVAGNAASTLASIAAHSGVPVAFGILTTNTVEQAIDRAGAKSGNKGFDAAMTAIEMANLLRAIRETGTR